MKPEKTTGYVLFSIEMIFAIYVIYLIFGVWGVGISVIGGCVLIYFLVWFISFVYEKSSIFKEPEKATKENFKATLAFNQALDYLLYFPVKALTIYYVYFNFNNGVLYIALYLLFLIISNKSWNNRNTQEANLAFSELLNKK